MEDLAVERSCAFEDADNGSSMAEPGEWFIRVANAIDKVFCFDAERFRKPDLGYHNVAAPMVEPRNRRVIEVHVLSQNSATINAFVVDGDLVLRDIIVNHHFARADNDHLAHL